MGAQNELQHVGFILDGNRRWAKAHNLPTLEGHRRGYANLLTIVDAAIERHIPYVSGYIFSTENWSRTKEEVGYLMKLAHIILTRDVKKLHQKGARVVWLGSPKEVNAKLMKAIQDAEELTKNNTTITLAICFNYGGQRELAEAAQAIVKDQVPAEEINEDMIEKYLYGGNVIPPLDLIIRTSGEQRLSGFMLWRSAYSELIFKDVYWPDFSPELFDECLIEYKHKQRRFGA